jgi:hypothetical protein
MGGDWATGILERVVRYPVPFSRLVFHEGVCVGLTS